MWCLHAYIHDDKKKRIEIYMMTIVGVEDRKMMIFRYSWMHSLLWQTWWKKKYIKTRESFHQSVHITILKIVGFLSNLIPFSLIFLFSISFLFLHRLILRIKATWTLLPTLNSDRERERERWKGKERIVLLFLIKDKKKVAFFREIFCSFLRHSYSIMFC